MNKKFMFLGFMVAAFVGFAHGGNLPLKTMDQRLDQFKIELNFQEKLAIKEKPEYVSLAWDLLPVPEVLAGWRETSRSKESVENATYFGLSFEKDRNRVSIDIIEMPPSSMHAQTEFLDVVNSTSKSELNYQAGPENLGTVSAVTTGKSNKSVMWIYRNMFFKISTDTEGFDPLLLAYWMQKQAEMHVFKIKDEK